MNSVRSDDRPTIGSLCTAANLITCTRLAGAAALPFLEPLSVPFYIVYGLSGLSDAIDGPIARKTGTESSFGAKLDSIGDLLFYGVTILRLLPRILQTLPVKLLVYLCTVLVIRLGVYGICAIKFHTFASVHTYLNKAASIFLFLLPFMLSLGLLIPYAVGELTLALSSALEEGAMHLLSPRYDPDSKCLLHVLNKLKEGAACPTNP